MTFEEYFGGWVRVIDTKELNKVVGQVSLIKRDLLCPVYSDIFNSFVSITLTHPPKYSSNVTIYRSFVQPHQDAPEGNHS